MSEQNVTSDGLAIVLGAVEIEVEFRGDGSKEKVQVRQLPIRLLNDWSHMLGDEASLVELYCDKIDKVRRAQLLKLSGETLALMRLQQNCTNRDELDKITSELAMNRSEIEKLNELQRWDDKLTPASHDRIVKIGYELNRPRFDRWLQDRHNAIGHLKEVYRQHLPEHPLVAPENDQPQSDGSTTSKSSSATQPSHSESPTAK
jgi:hypothetical protein